MRSKELDKLLQEILGEVKEHDLTVDSAITDHDAIISAQATKLMQIGYLEYEIAVYAAAYYKDNGIYYYLSEREENIDKFVHSCLLKHINVTPVRYFYKRYDLINTTENDIKKQFRLEIAKRMHHTYPTIFFDALADLTNTPSNNTAYPLLKEMCGQLDSSFDLNHLKLFGNLLDMLLLGRQLNDEGYLLLKQWLDKEYQKIAIEPIASGGYRRTYSGFAYQKKSTDEVKFFCDAYPYLTKEKQRLFINRGHIVTPILSTTYYANAIGALAAAKDTFIQDLQRYLGTNYISLMKALHKLPAAVNIQKYKDYHEKIRISGNPQALEDFQYYGYLWNVDEKNF